MDLCGGRPARSSRGLRAAHGASHPQIESRGLGTTAPSGRRVRERLFSADPGLHNRRSASRRHGRSAGGLSPESPAAALCSRAAADAPLRAGTATGLTLAGRETGLRFRSDRRVAAGPGIAPGNRAGQRRPFPDGRVTGPRPPPEPAIGPRTLPPPARPLPAKAGRPDPPPRTTAPRGAPGPWPKPTRGKAARPGPPRLTTAPRVPRNP